MLPATMPGCILAIQWLSPTKFGPNRPDPYACFAPMPFQARPPPRSKNGGRAPTGELMRKSTYCAFPITVPNSIIVPIRGPLTCRPRAAHLRPRSGTRVPPSLREADCAAWRTLAARIRSGDMWADLLGDMIEKIRSDLQWQWPRSATCDSVSFRKSNCATWRTWPLD